MSLVVIEGFELGEDDLRARADANSATADWTASAPIRTGVGRLNFTNAADYLAYDFTAHATCILGVAWTTQTSLPAGTYDIARLYGDSGATLHITLAGNKTDGSYEVWRGDRATGTLLGSTGSGLWTSDLNFRYLELKVVISDSVGTVDLVVEAVNRLSLTGQDTKNGGTNVTFDSAHLVSSTPYNTYFDDLYVCTGAGSLNNDLLGPVHVEALYPDGNGNYSQLTGSDGDSTNNYLLAGQGPDTGAPDTATYVGDSTSGNKDTYTFDDLSVAGVTVHGVEVRFDAVKSYSGAKSFRAVHRRASTDSTGPDVNLTESFEPYYQQWEQDPNGPIDWTDTNLNASEFGFEVRP